MLPGVGPELAYASFQYVRMDRNHAARGWRLGVLPDRHRPLLQVHVPNLKQRDLLQPHPAQGGEPDHVKHGSVRGSDEQIRDLVVRERPFGFLVSRGATALADIMAAPGIVLGVPLGYQPAPER